MVTTAAQLWQIGPGGMIMGQTDIQYDSGKVGIIETQVGYQAIAWA